MAEVLQEFITFIDDIKIIYKSTTQRSDEELMFFIGRAKEQSKGVPVEYIELVFDKDEEGEYTDAFYHYKKVPFDRIRRITGYLVGTIDLWNDAKQAELKNRTKHSAQYDDDYNCAQCKK